MKRITDMNHQIAIAAEEQSAVTDEINRNVANIQDVTHQTAGVRENLRTSAQELAHAEQDLAAVIAQFKV